MENKKYLESLKDYEIDKEAVEKVGTIYGMKCPVVVSSIITSSTKAIFLDNSRVLTYNEIVHADTEYDVDFIKQGLLPLFDCGDNNFIVYHFKEQNWSLYNIVDNCSFKKRDSLEELL